MRDPEVMALMQRPGFMEKFQELKSNPQAAVISNDSIEKEEKQTDNLFLLRLYVCFCLFSDADDE